MKAISSRICSIILLVAAVLALSGIAGTAEALLHAGEGVACCESDSHGNDSGTCTISYCSCAFCLTIDFVVSPTVSRVTAAADAFNPHRPLFAFSEFINSIDYPPEML